jgi:hypothetical protein
MHVVCTRDREGSLRLYVDGKQAAQRAAPGTFASWDPGFQLMAGSEVAVGADTQPWVGLLQLVSIYDRALSAEEVQWNYTCGVEAGLVPIAAAGADENVDLPAQAVLKARLESAWLGDVNDPAQVTYEWSQQSGPGKATFTAPQEQTTNASFDSSGVYVLNLRVTINRKGYPLQRDVPVTVIANDPPDLPEFSSQTIVLPAALQLQAIANDDGLPNPPGRLTYHWKKLQGSGEVVFAEAHSSSTTATFSNKGHYVLQVSVSDGQAEVTRQIPVDAYTAPVIKVRRMVPAIKGQKADLEVKILDDGLFGDAKETLKVTWSASNANLTIDNASARKTRVSAGESGRYPVTVVVDNGHGQVFAELAVRVEEPQAQTAGGGGPPAGPR